ncbi:MAG: NDP-sugar synthase [archaeon]|nr:NDP-sugar synthase [archaeon]
MKAVILAGGKGKRFGIAQKVLPKSLVPIGGNPILKAVIDDFAANPEVDEIIVLAGPNRKIRNIVNWTRFKKPVRVLNIHKGVFGDLLSIRNLVGNQPFLLGNADNLVIGKLPTKAQFEKSGAWMVTTVTKTIKSGEFTGIDFEGEVVLSVDEKTRASRSGFGVIGKKMLSPRVFEFIEACDFPKNAGIGAMTQRLFEQGKKIIPVVVPRENLIHITNFRDWWHRSKRGDSFYAAWFATKSRVPKRKPRKPRRK